MIRGMRREEIDEVVDIYLRGYESVGKYYYVSRSDAKSYIKWLYRRDPDGFLVAYEGRIVGFVASDANWISSRGRVGAVHELVVDPSHRGKGAGRSLLERAIERFRSLGLSIVELWVGEDNPARKFYEKLGFKPQESVGVWIKMVKQI